MVGHSAGCSADLKVVKTAGATESLTVVLSAEHLDRWWAGWSAARTDTS
jgi:hypothetical protein